MTTVRFKWATPPYVTWLLIAINVIVFLLQIATATGRSDEIDQAAALVPAAFAGGGMSGGALPAPLTLFTYMFLHGNFWHIFGNMIFLWVFGDDIEEAIGPWRFLGLLSLPAVSAPVSLSSSATRRSKAELIGASGAIAGVMVAYLMFRPCAKVTVLLVLLPLRVRAFWVIGGWAIWQFFEVVEPRAGWHRLLGACRRPARSAPSCSC